MSGTACLTYILTSSEPSAAPLLSPAGGLLWWRHGHSRPTSVDCRRIPQGGGNGPRPGLRLRATVHQEQQPVAGHSRSRPRRPGCSATPWPRRASAIPWPTIPTSSTWPARTEGCGGNPSTPWSRSFSGGALGIPYVVAHPGAYTTGSEPAGWNASSRRSMKSTAKPGGCKSAACWKPRQGREPRSAGGSSTWPPSSRGAESRPAGRLLRHLPRLRGGLPAGNPERLSGDDAESSTASWAWGRFAPFISTTASANGLAGGPSRPHRPRADRAGRFSGARS